MPLPLDKLKKQLQTCLLPLYLLSGDETLLLQEASDAIRAAAMQQGFSGYERWYVDNSFQWDRLLTVGRSGSLFSDKQLIELRCQQPIAGVAATRLEAYAVHPPTQQILLVICGKLDSTVRKTSWFKTWSSAGACWPIWPLELDQWTEWLSQRLVKADLQTDSLGIKALFELTEGNLGASVQAIEKLRLFHGSGFIEADSIYQVVDDNARFNLFELIDAALQGEAKRCLRILNRLKEIGIDPHLVLWAAVSGLRQLAASLHALADALPLAKVFVAQRVLPRRQRGLRQALQRLTLENLPHLFALTNRVDRISKGIEPGEVWDSLQALSLALATGKTQ